MLNYKMLAGAVMTVLLGLAPPARGDSALFYTELNLIGGYSDREDWVGKSEMLSNSVGFEDYRKFSDDYGDFLTTDLQVRLAYDSAESTEDAWAVEVHNAWAEYAPGPGKRLRAGHFDVPFGLEPLVDTHGTLLQTQAEKTIGLKKDWGVAFKGMGQAFDFETALQLGSGMSIYRRDDSFLSSARIGTAAGKNLVMGTSLLYGRVLQTHGMSTFPRNHLASDDAVRKRRWGVDAQYGAGPYTLKSEASLGRDDDTDVAGYLAEIDYTLPRDQNWEFQAQYQSWFNDTAMRGSDDSTVTIGSSYKLTQFWTVRLAAAHDTNMMTGNEDDKIWLQFYYFGV